jgi:hypothetical protein
MWEWYAQKVRGSKCESTIWVMIQQKLRFEHKTRMNGNHIIKILKLYRIVFFSHKLWFFMDHFCHEFFYVWHFLLLHCGLHSLKVLHKKWCSPHYVSIIRKEMIEIFNEPKKKDVIFSSMFFPMFFFWLKNCFDSLIKIDASHHYYITKSTW